MYTSDHGNFGKFSVSNAGLNMPMLIRWPQLEHRNIASDALIAFTDILPTFLELAGGTIPADRDGQSFKEVLKSPQSDFREYAYGVSEHQNIWIPQVFPSRMVTDGRWKYTRNFNAYEVHEQNFGSNEDVNALIRAGAEKNQDIPYEELYDLDNDPYELNNLAGNKELAEIKERLVDELYRWMKSQGDYLAEEGPLPLFHPTHFALDQKNKLYTPPAGTENRLTEADYRER